jgi:uncharacterized LabA/DUF88 family protein
MPGKYAVLVDGGFIKRKLQDRHKHFPTIAEIQTEVDRIKTHRLLRALALLRVYFYDAPPAAAVITNPLNGNKLDLSSTPNHANNDRLQKMLEMQPDFALRSGETAVHGWSLGSAALRSLMKQSRALVADDLVPNIEQKGVDLRIGLDIARLSLRQLVHAIVVVTGDSDMVPAFKFARREGIRVLLGPHGPRCSAGAEGPRRSGSLTRRDREALFATQIENVWQRKRRGTKPRPSPPASP